MILDLMEDCDKMHEVRTITARHNTEKIDYLIDSEYMIRSKTNSHSDPSGMISDTIILNRIRDINTQYSTNTGMRIELTIDRIVRSGIFYRLYQFEEENGSVNRDIIKKLFGIDYRSNFTVSNEISKKKKDYVNWKKAFEL